MHLYEWSWSDIIPGLNVDGLKQYLHGVWQSRLIQEMEAEHHEEQDDEYLDDEQHYRQGFLRFDGKKIGAKNYVGFLRYNGLELNIYPKVFRETYKDPTTAQQTITQHLLYWFSYSTRIRFPFSELGFKEQRFDNLLEPFIFIFAEITSKKLAQQPYQRFEEVTERTTFLKGRLAINEYINRSIVSGNFHQLYSTYDSFEYNNKFNRIVKYVTRMLYGFTRNEYSLHRLKQILFLLDDVDDCICTEQDCNTVQFNRMYDGWISILNMCRIFLANNAFQNQDERQPNYCFLVPMELIFEEFVAGFFMKHFGNKYTIHPQKSELYLVSNPALFQLRHDIFITKADKQCLIIDTKYKLRNLGNADGKHGVSQADLYQMVSYAFRRGCNEVVLLYPNDSVVFDQKPVEFIIESGFSVNDKIRVRAMDVPFWGELETIQFKLEVRLKDLLAAPQSFS